MRCPYRFMEFTTDETVMECREDCAFLVEVDVRGNYGGERSVCACGLVAKGKPVNTVEVPRKDKR